MFSSSDVGVFGVDVGAGIAPICSEKPTLRSGLATSAV